MSDEQELCPYCGELMQEGAILGDRYRLKWQPADQSLVMGIWSSGHSIGEKSLLQRPRVTGYRCANCETIIVFG